jgi:hypothetical protein
MSNQSNALDLQRPTQPDKSCFHRDTERTDLSRRRAFLGESIGRLPRSIRSRIFAFGLKDSRGAGGLLWGRPSLARWIRRSRVENKCHVDSCRRKRCLSVKKISRRAPPWVRSALFLTGNCSPDILPADSVRQGSAIYRHRLLVFLGLLLRILRAGLMLPEDKLLVEVGSASLSARSCSLAANVPGASDQTCALAFPPLVVTRPEAS